MDDAGQLTLQEIEKSLPRDQDTFFAQQLISQVQSELGQKKRHLVSITSKWVIAFEYVKMREEALLLERRSIREERDYFSGMVSVLHGLGQLLLRQLKLHEEVDTHNLLGYSFEDLSACVYELEGIIRIFSSSRDERWNKFVEGHVFGSKEGETSEGS